jgi:hypothetical protein
MANRYWVGGTGTWDATTTTNWSTTSGGSGGASVPSTADVAIFDSASNVAGAGASYTVTRTATTNVQGINMANPSAGTLTFAGSSVIGVTTAGLTISGTINWTNTGTLTASGTTSTFNTGTTTIASTIVISGASITVTLNGNVSTSAALTLTQGTLALGTNTFTALTANISGTSTRTFNFGTGNLTLTGNGITIFTATTQTSLTVSGTPTINCTYAGSTGTRTIACGAGVTTFRFNISAGSDTVTFTANNRVNNLNFTGFSGTLSNVALSLYGNVTLSNTMTLTAGANAWTFVGSSTLTTNGELLDFPVTINGSGITVTLGDACTIGSTRTLTLTQGTLALSSFTLSVGLCTISGTTARTFNFGTGNLTLTGNGATIFDATTQTNLTVSGTPVINCTYAGSTGTRTITSGTTATTFSFNISAGTDTVLFTDNNFVNDLNLTGFAGTITATITIYGSLTNVSGVTFASNGLTFAATTTGKTITSAGRTFALITFNGVGGGWTLQDAMSSAGAITVTNGSLNTNGFSVIASQLSSSNSNTRTITLGSSTVSLLGTTPVDFTTSTNLTFSSGTSQINCSSGSSTTFQGGGQTFYNVSFTNSAVTNYFIFGINTFNNLSFPTTTTRASVAFNANQIINGTLTANGTDETKRYSIGGGGSIRQITANAISLSYVNFSDITAAGSSIPWTGTSFGDIGNNTNITFDAPKTVYWNLAGANNWSSNGWAASSGGSPSLSNFPLPQDTVIIDNSSAGTSITVDQIGYNITDLDTSTRTSAFSIIVNNGILILGDITLSSSLTISGTAILNMYSITGSSRSLTTNGATISAVVSITGTDNNNAGTVTLGSNFTSTNSFVLSSGLLNLNNYTLQATTFEFGSNTLTTQLNFGNSGTINLTATTTTTVWFVPAVAVPSITILGTSNVRLTGAAGAGITRTIQPGAVSEANSINFYVTAGAGTVSITAGNVRDLDFTGFTGSWANTVLTIYGSLNIATGMTVTAGANAVTFAATSIGKTITSAGKTLGFPVVFNGIGGEWTLQDAMTTGTTYGVTLTYGSLILNNFTLTCNNFASNNSNIRFIDFGSSGTIAVNGTGTVWDTTSVQELFIYGTPVVNMTNATTTAKTITPGAPDETNSISFKISGAGAATVTITAGNIRDLDFTGFTGTWANTALTLFGSLTVSTGMTVTAGANALTFAASSTGKTIRSNGKTLGFPITFSSTTGGWTLQDALNIGANALTINSGTFSTGGFNVTAASLSSSNSNTRSITLGASTVALSGTGTVWNFTTTGLTFSSGTSTISFSGASVTLQGGGQTFYNMSFTSTAPTDMTFNGANTYNNLTFTHPAAASYVQVVFNANQTINGTLSVTGTLLNTARLAFIGSLTPATRTIYAGAISGLDDIDFKNIVASGPATPWTGTRLGDAGGNSNITFAATKTVYWNLTGTQNWNATAWATSSGGTPAAANFPLPQDTCIFDNTGAATTVTINANYMIGTLNMSARTSAVTLSIPGFNYPVVNGDVNLGSGVTVSGVSYSFVFINTDTQTFTSSAISITGSLLVYGSGTLNLGSAITLGSEIQQYFGTFNTQNYNVTCAGVYIDSSSSFNRTTNLGSSTITITGGSSSTGLRLYGLSNGSTTFNAGTSTITFSGTTSALILDGMATFRNLSFTNTTISNIYIGSSTYIGSTAYTSTVSFTCNNFTVTGRSGSVGISRIQFQGCTGVTVNGTFTLNAGTSVIYRTFLYSFDTTTTITAAAVGTFTDIDFHNITAAGAAGTWSGTRLGNGSGNSNITFPAAKTVYWNLTGTPQNWSATAWATAPSGTPALNNFPLAQDTAAFTNNGTAIGQVVTYNANYLVGSITYASRTTATTLACTSFAPWMTGSLTLYSSLTSSGTTAINFIGTGTQSINTAGITMTYGLNLVNTGTVQLSAATTTTGTITHGRGTLNLNGFTLTGASFTETFVPTNRTITFGTSTINLTGNSATILSYQNGVGTYLTMTGTPTFNCTYSGATGTRSINLLDSSVTSVNINVTAGTDILNLTNRYINNLNLTGFGGKPTGLSNSIFIYGDVDLGSSVDLTTTNFIFSFRGSTDQTIKSNGRSGGILIEVIKTSGTLRLLDNLTLNSTNDTGGFYLVSGTFDLNGFNLTTKGISILDTSAKTITQGSGQINITGKDEGVFSGYSRFIPVFEIENTTGLTYTTPLNITFTGTAGNQSFYGGGLEYGTISAGASPLFIYGNNTIDTLTNSASPTIILFEGGSTQSLTTFSVNGISNVRTYLTSTNTSQYTLSKATAWNVGANTDDNGNNTGIYYVAGTVDYLNITYMIGVLISTVGGQFFLFF